MTEAKDSTTDMRAELLTSIGTLLAALKAVGDGDLSHQLTLNYPDTHPVGGAGVEHQFHGGSAVGGPHQSLLTWTS